MNLLLDTHVILWRLSDDFSDTGNLCFMSSASIWEIGIKQGLGKLEIPSSFLEVLKMQGSAELPIAWEHGRCPAELPMFHRDPFDRMLIAQACIEDMVMLSIKDRMEKYDTRVV